MVDSRLIAGLQSDKVADSRPEAFGPNSLQVQRVLYDLSGSVFDYAPPTFELDNLLDGWKAQKRVNAEGSVPEVYTLETRIGASLALLGYLDAAKPATLTSVFATSGTLRIMEPVLKQHIAAFAAQKVAFQVAALEYDLETGVLVNDTASVTRVARNLGLPLFSSTLAHSGDVRNTAVLASVAAQLGPAIHVFDGLRGSRQSEPLDVKTLQRVSAKASSLADAFKLTNAALGTKLAPFEYHGGANPETVLVTLGNAAVLALAGPNVGVIHVRLYAPFLANEFVSVLPESTKTLVVVDSTPELYSDVAAALVFGRGFGNGPRVQYIPIGNDITPTQIANEIGVDAPDFGGVAVKVWDSDKSTTADAAGIIALAPYSSKDTSVYTTFDNYVNGGSVQIDLQFNKVAHWPIDSANVVLVNNAELLKSYDVVKTAKNGASLVIAAESDEALEKALSPALKAAILAKKLTVYRLNAAAVDTAGTEGRTASFVNQAVVWTLATPDLDVDTVTSRIVHANGKDTELVAAKVNKLVDNVLSTGLVKVEIAAPSETPEPADLLALASATSFASVVPPAAEEPESEVLNVTSVAQRFAFQEAFAESEPLRPDVSTKTFIAKVKLNERVTPNDYDRHIFHLELDIAGTGLKYAIGESLGVHAPNDAAGVQEFLEWYGLDGQQVVGVPHRDDPTLTEYKTVYQTFRDNLDLFGKVPKRFYDGLSAYATDDKEKAHLERLASADGAAELKRRTEEDFDNYADILGEFASAHPPLEALVELIAPLKRREYSIASSQKMHPNEVHLLIVVVDWDSKRTGKKRFGQCSKYLSALPKGAEVVVSVKPSVMKLPSDTTKPIIMAGLGTGLAPFKAFLEEKLWQRQQGHEIGEIYLFLGSRHQRQEYLYGELFEAYKAAGVLTHIGAAFSRDQPEKIYIQHRIQQMKGNLENAFVKQEGTFYLCGPTWPVPDISEALTDIVVSEAAKRNEKVDDTRLIEDLKVAERYILEVY